MASASPEAWNRLFGRQRWGRWPSEHIVRAFARLADPAGRSLRVLEVGCGPGAQLAFLASEGHQAFGVDFSPVALAVAKSRLSELGQPARLSIGRAWQLPFCSAAFDVVIDCECFAYLGARRLPEAWAEVARVLGPGGSAISQQFTDGCDTGVLAYLQDPPGLLAERELLAVVEASGLQLIDAQVARRTHGPGRLVIEEAIVVARKPPAAGGPA